MKNKPLFFTILSIMCLIEPAIKILYFKASTDFEFSVILGNLLSRNSFIDVIDFWFMFPIAGLLLMKIRKWTYFSFLASLAYINYKIFSYEKYTWPFNTAEPLFYHYVVAFASVAIFIYMLMPKTREPFFNQRVRWWEPKARYTVSIPCKLQNSTVTFQTNILNISQSGAFLQDCPYLKVGERFQLEINFLGEMINVDVDVVNKHTSQNVVGFGVKFNFKTINQGMKITKVMKVLKKTQTEFGDRNSKVAA